MSAQLKAPCIKCHHATKEDDNRSPEEITPKADSGHLKVDRSQRRRKSSLSKLAINSPSQYGTIVEFCRGKGHGFVQPDGEDAKLFLHIAEITDDIAVEEGDRVEFKTVSIPPNLSKRIVVDARLINVDDEATYHRWNNKPL